MTHEIANEVLELVEDQPGISIEDVSSALDIGTFKITLAVIMLRESGQLLEEYDDEPGILYPAEEGAGDEDVFWP